MGVRALDSSVAGLGGCPYAPGATGNVSTEVTSLFSRTRNLNKREIYVIRTLFTCWMGLGYNFNRMETHVSLFIVFFSLFLLDLNMVWISLL